MGYACASQYLDRFFLVINCSYFHCCQAYAVALEIIANYLKQHYESKYPQHTFRFIQSNQSCYARRFKKTHPKHYGWRDDPHDFDVWRDHLHTGVIEVKTCLGRHRTLDNIMYKWGGPLMGRIKIHNLDYYYARRGFKVGFAWRTADDWIITSTLSSWKHNGGAEKIASFREAGKTNHGEEERKVDPKDYKFPPVACKILGKL